MTGIFGSRLYISGQISEYFFPLVLEPTSFALPFVNWTWPELNPHFAVFIKASMFISCKILSPQHGDVVVQWCWGGIVYKGITHKIIREDRVTTGWYSTLNVLYGHTDGRAGKPITDCKVHLRHQKCIIQPRAKPGMNCTVVRCRNTWWTMRSTWKEVHYTFVMYDHLDTILGWLHQ